MEFDETNRYMPEMFMLEGFYRDKPALDAQAWQQALSAQLGSVGIVKEGGGDSNVMMLALHDYPIEYEDKDKPMPAMVTVMRGEADSGKQDYGAILQQTWDWPQAHEMVEESRYNLMAGELMARRLPIADRYKIFRALTRAMITLTAPLALHPVQTGCFFSPQQWITAQDAGHAGYGFINVRLYNISNHAGDMLMDTRGLAVFGVPDLQCHFRDLDPQDVGSRLYDMAMYLLEKGDVIADGHTVFAEHWTCRHEDSLIEPRRPVLDVCPHPPHAAGNRE